MSTWTPPQPNRRRFAVIVIGLLIAGAGLAFVLYVASTSGTGGGSPNSGQSVTLVVARQAVPEGSPLTQEMVTTVSVPGNLAPAGGLNSTGDVNGQYAAIGIEANQVITREMLTATPVTHAAGGAPLQIPTGDVALALPTTSLQATGGYVQAGDHIDIMLESLDANGAATGSVEWGIEDVPVLEASAPTAPSGASSAQATGSVLVVALPRLEAEEMGVILTGRGGYGFLSFVIRPANANNTGYVGNGAPSKLSPPAGSSAISPADLNSAFGH